MTTSTTAAKPASNATRSPARLIAAEPGWRVVVRHAASERDDVAAGSDTYAVAAWLDDGQGFDPIVMWGAAEPVRASIFGSIEAIIPPGAADALADGLIVRSAESV